MPGASGCRIHITRPLPRCSHVTSPASEELCRRLEDEARLASEARACTGVLGIHPMSRDIKIDNMSITFHGSELLQDTRLELSCGQRYGLIGENGSGKETC